MRLLDLANRIAVADNILPWAFPEARRLHMLLPAHLFIAGDELPLYLETCPFDQPDVAGASLQNLELKRAWPYAFGGRKERAGNVVKNAAVPGLAHAVLIGLFAPLEFSAQVIDLIFVLGHYSAKIVSGYVNHALFHLEDLIGVVIQPFGLKQNIEPGKILPIEQADQLAVRRNPARLLRDPQRTHCGCNYQKPKSPHEDCGHFASGSICRFHLDTTPLCFRVFDQSRSRGIDPVPHSTGAHSPDAPEFSAAISLPRRTSLGKLRGADASVRGDRRQNILGRGRIS